MLHSTKHVQWRGVCVERCMRWWTAYRALYKVANCLGQWWPPSHWHNVAEMSLCEWGKEHVTFLRRQWRLLHILNTKPGGGGWSEPGSSCITSQERPNTHWAGGWVCLTAGLEGMEILASTRIWSPDCSSCSEFLCWLCYPVTEMMIEICKGTGQSVEGCLASVLRCQVKNLQLVLVCAMSKWPCLWKSVIKLW